VLFVVIIAVFGANVFFINEKKTECIKKSGGILEETFYSIKTVFYLDAVD